MKTFRLVLLAVIAGGVAFLASDRPFDAGTWPLPGSQLSVRVPFKLRRAGDYFIEVAMPKASTDKMHVVDETLPCELSYTIETDGVSSQAQRVSTIKSTGEYGWANIVLYNASPAFHLRRGEYTITVIGGPGCVAARERGATITISEVVRQPTEQYLLSTFLTFLARVAVFGGLSVLIVIELRSKSKYPLERSRV
jgi:hypothetical protein